MFDKINISNIVKGHCATLYNASTGKAGWGDIILFGLLPVLVSSGLLWMGYVLKENSITILLASYAILTGLLFNLLVLVFDLIRKESEPVSVDAAVEAEWKNKQGLLKQTFASISFCVLEGISLSVVTLAALLPCHWCQWIVSFFVYSVTINFALTLLMILKRIHALLGAEFSEPNKT